MTLISICACAWNDLGYLKLMVESVRKTARLPYEIIIVDNGSDDGTLEWLKTQGRGRIFSPDDFTSNPRRTQVAWVQLSENKGVSAVNYAVDVAAGEYILDINADMVLLPGWDIALYKEAKRIEKRTKKFLLGLNLIEPFPSIEPQYILFNAGGNYDEFDGDKLNEFYAENRKALTIPNHVQYSHPIFMRRDMWKEMGGVDDKNYGLGQATDHDIPATLYYKCGVSDFVRLGNAHAYHFSSKTISKLKPVDNGPVFEKKWGLTIDEFRKLLDLRREM